MLSLERRNSIGGYKVATADQRSAVVPGQSGDVSFHTTLGSDAA